MTEKRENERKCVICERYLPDEQFEYPNINICRRCGDEISEDNPYIPNNPIFDDFS